MIKICKRCSVEFEGHGNKIYCDNECYQEAHRSRSLSRYHLKDEDAKREHQEAAWRSNLLTKFNMTPIDYAEMYANQSGECAICGVQQKDEDRRFAVDHNHETGKVRGLLCASCNKGLGHFKDDPYRMVCAIKYLQERGK